MKRVFAGLVVASITVGAPGVASAHDVRYPTSATWGYSSAMFGEPAFLGYVDSPNEDCRGPRRIQMHRISGGRDRVIGEGRTESGDYDWKIDYRDPLPRGRYYARVLPRDLGGGAAHDHICRTYRTGAVSHNDLS